MFLQWRTERRTHRHRQRKVLERVFLFLKSENRPIITAFYL